jgi:hypothetical protein
MTRLRLSSTVSDDLSIRHTRTECVDLAVLENDFIRLTVTPKLGGKITSLIRLESNHEYLLQPSDPGSAYRHRQYGDKFEDYEPSGIDECLPTIAACVYGEFPFLDKMLPDHGDIWCLPATLEVFGEQVWLSSTIRSLPLRFTKRIYLQEDTVRLDYEVRNLSQSGVKFLWSAHPLVRLCSTAEIFLPQDMNEVSVGWSKDERLGKPGERCMWPIATDYSGNTVELNKVALSNNGTAEKLFTGRLTEGFCGLFLPRENESISFRFDPSLVPFVGIWICQGGWPPTRAQKQFTVALEPCNGRHDSLEQAISESECATLDGGGTMRWWMEIAVNAGTPRFQRV